MPQITGQVLRDWRESRGWIVPETARRIIRAADSAELHVASLESVERYLYRWEAGRPVDEHYQHLLVLTFGLASRGELAAGPPRVTGERPQLEAGNAAVPAVSRAPESAEAVVMRAASESAQCVSADAMMTVPPLSVAHLMTEVRRLAHLHGAVTPLVLLEEARQVRDQARLLTDRTRQTSQLADLYLVTGAMCGLMARGSLDLAVWPAAIEQANAARAYGRLAGHHGLQAWAAGFEGLLAFWCGQPRSAIVLLEDGLSVAPAGTAKVRLHCIAARAWACLGAADRVREELIAADRAASGGDLEAEDLHDKIAGEFGWGAARRAMCAASALVLVGDARAAADRATDAIRLAGSEPSAGLIERRARVDLAHAQVVYGDLDAVEVTLSPVWGLEPEHRRFSIVHRMGDVADALAVSRYAGSRPAGELTEHIRSFTAASAPQAALSSAVIEPGGK